MFLTRSEYSERLPPLEGYKNCLGWGIVEMAARLPWFLLEVEVRDDRGHVEGTRTLLITRMSTLADALKRMGEGRNARVAPHRVLSFHPPGWDEANHCWSSREILEIWDAQVERETTPHKLWLLKSSDGKELLEPDVAASSLVRKVSRIFGAPHRG